MMPGTDSFFSKSSFCEAPGPHFLFEQHLFKLGKNVVAGVDEAGRGPLAGPVAAAAVILDPHKIPSGLNDSKKLTDKSRRSLFLQIMASAHSISFACICPRQIDEINILQATFKAMSLAVAGLNVQAQSVLIDGRDVPDSLKHMGHAIIKGDAKSLSIAAASIVAKVMRDQMMIRAGSLWPQYGFAGHKGYGSSSHMAAINQFGPCPIHRMSFSPMRDEKTAP